MHYSELMGEIQLGMKDFKAGNFFSAGDNFGMALMVATGDGA